jgi:hypothetical protein
MAQGASAEIEDATLAALEQGMRTGWENAHLILGARNCTIRNDGTEDMRIPIGQREAVLDLAPGEQATVRTVEPEWWG